LTWGGEDIFSEGEKGYGIRSLQEEITGAAHPLQLGFEA